MVAERPWARLRITTLTHNHLESRAQTMRPFLLGYPQCTAKIVPQALEKENASQQSSMLLTRFDARESCPARSGERSVRCCCCCGSMNPSLQQGRFHSVPPFVVLWMFMIHAASASSLREPQRGGCTGLTNYLVIVFNSTPLRALFRSFVVSH